MEKPEPLVKNSDPASYTREKDIGEPWSVYRANLQTIVSFSSSIQLEMMLTHQHQLGQIVGESSSNKVQRMHRYDRNCLCVWKIARNLKLANRLKLLWPVSNCKHLGLRSCCTVFGPSPAVRSFYLNIFHLHGQGGSGRLWIRNGYNVVVYDRSMKMDGPCALDRCMTDGTENVEFFLDFFLDV